MRKSFALFFVGLCATILLSGCSNDNVSPIDRIQLALDINSKSNQPIGGLTDGTAPSTADNIYLSGRVLNVSRVNSVYVRWSREGTIVATQVLVGNRDSSTPFDFDRNSKSSSNYFYSSVKKPDVSWPLGNYLVEVLLDGKYLIESHSFKVVPANDYSNLQSQTLITSVATSDRVDLTRQEVIGSKTSFARDAKHIYLGVVLKEARPNAKMGLSVDYVAGGFTVVSFQKTLSAGETSILFDASLDQLGDLWGSQLWGAGLYRVKLLLDGAEVRTLEFRVA